MTGEFSTTNLKGIQRDPLSSSKGTRRSKNPRTRLRQIKAEVSFLAFRLNEVGQPWRASEALNLLWFNGFQGPMSKGPWTQDDWERRAELFIEKAQNILQEAQA